MKLNVENFAFDKLLIPTAMVTGIVFLLTVLVVLSSKKHRTDRYERNWFTRTLYLLFIGCVSVLAATSFGSILQQGHMEHYALMAHTTAAGGFVFLTLAVAIFFLPRGTATKEIWLMEKWSVWVLIAGAMVTTATMLVSMLPLLDTTGLLQAVQIHRYAGLVTAIAAIFHAFSLIAGRLGYR